MKIKVVLGIDMRLWKHGLNDAKPSDSMYDELLTFVVESFQFTDASEFRLTFQDEDDTQTTIAGREDFEDAFTFARSSNQKSLKLHVVPTNSNSSAENPIDSEPVDDEKKEANTDSTEAPQQSPPDESAAPRGRPSREDVEAFLGDEAVLAQLPDLVLSVLGVMEQSSFSVPLTEAMKAVLLSNEAKYAQMRSSPVWPMFVDELLPSVAPKIEFFAQMMRANGQSIDIAMVRQWMPTMMAALRMRFGGGQCKGKGRGGWRGGHCGRGRGGFRGHRGGHCGQRGRGRWGHRGWNGHRGRGRFGHHGRRGGFNPWAQPPAQGQEQSQSTQMRGAEAFSYTEELVAIMNMGFGDMAKIKQLLVEHKGDKQVVVQALVSSK